MDSTSTGNSAPRPASAADPATVGLAALLATVVLLVAAPLYFLGGDRGERLAPTLLIPGSAFQTVEGKAHPIGSSLQLQEPGPRGMVMLAAALEPATTVLGDYTRLDVELEQADPAGTAYLLWGEGRALEHNLELQPATATVPLEQLEAATNEISALGLAIPLAAGDGQPVLHGIRLSSEPPGVTGIYARLLSGWFGTDGYDQRTINFVKGGTDERLMSPVVAAGLWLGLAMGCWLIITLLRRRRPSLSAVVVLFAVAWILLDVRWQTELGLKLLDTRESFAGQPSADRAVPMLGGAAMLELTRSARTHLADGARLHIVSDDEGLGFYARYQLLPLASLYRDSFRPGVLRHLDPGDGILLLGSNDATVGSVPGQLPAALLQQLPLQFPPARHRGPDGHLVTETAVDGGTVLEAVNDDGDWHSGSPHPALLQGYYRAEFTLRAPDDEGHRVRLQIWRTGPEANQLLAEREVTLRRSLIYETHALPFLMTGSGNIEYRIRNAPAGTRSAGVTLDALSDEQGQPPADLGFIGTTEQGPFRLVRLLQQNDLGLLFEVQ